MGPLSYGFGAPDPQSYLSLLLRLMPDGYSQDPDGPRMTELEAYATAMWVGRMAIDRAFAQSYPHLATELLAAWEQVYQLPNDAARSIEERQARLRAAEATLAGASAPAINAALSIVAPLSQALANRRAEIEAAAAADEQIWHAGLQLDASEWADPATRRAAARVLDRMLPARLHRTPGYRPAGPSAHALPEPEEQLFVTEGATWGGSELLGQTVLKRQDTDARAVRLPANRHREYSGLVKLMAEDLNELQELSLMRPARGAGVSDTFPDAGIDSAIVHIEAACPDDTETVIDDSIDWRQRMVMIAVQLSTSDIRPGQSGDSTGPNSQAVEFWSTGAGADTTLGGANALLDSGLNVYARDSDGALVAYNTTGSTVYMRGIVIATPSTTAAEGAFVDFEDGAPLSDLNADFWDALTTATLARPNSIASVASWPNHPGPGALIRLACVVGVEGETTVTLDTEASWTDRILMVAATVFDVTATSDNYRGPIYPGNPEDDCAIQANNDAIAVGYTGPGLSSFNASSGYNIPIAGNGNHVFVDQFGRLKLRWATSGSEPKSYMLMIVASEKLGERTAAPATSPSLAVTDDTQIEPHILNGWQDRALLGQVRERAAEFFQSADPVDAFPLGPKLDAGGFPERWLIRRSPYPDHPEVIPVPRRQPVAGQHWRFFEVTWDGMAVNEFVIDDTIDWRDRFFWFVGTNGLTRQAARYSGPGESGTVSGARGYRLLIITGAYIRARASDGALVVRFQSGSAATVRGIVCASFPLGPRSV